MTFQENIESMMRENHLRHISTMLREDGTVTVSVHARTAPRVKGFDPATYYRENRERIRKYQHEYYLKTRAKNSTKGNLNTAVYIPTPEDLAKAMAYLYSRNGMDLKADDLRDTAIQVMQFFGFEREVVGNHLEHDEIAMMYQLEDLGLVDTRVEEYNLLDGNSWRVNYFVLNVKRIKEYSSMSVERDEASNVYEELPEEAWVR